MDLLTRTQILEADDLPSEIVEVPEWGGSVKVRGLTGAERDKFEAAIVHVQGRRVMRLDMENLRARLVALTVIDAEGNPVFWDKDIVALGQKSAAALNRVFQAAQRLSGLTDTDLEELAKN